MKPTFWEYNIWCQQSQVLKSRCHTKRRMDAATRATFSFGMTTTKTLKSVFSWHSSYIRHLNSLLAPVNCLFDIGFSLSESQQAFWKKQLIDTTFILSDHVVYNAETDTTFNPSLNLQSYSVAGTKKKGIIDITMWKRHNFQPSPVPGNLFSLNPPLNAIWFNLYYLFEAVPNERLNSRIDSQNRRLSTVIIYNCLTPPCLPRYSPTFPTGPCAQTSPLYKVNCS